MIEIFPIGSEVLVDKEIPAIIVAVEIRGVRGLVTYQCTWWDERKRCSEWLTEAEIVPRNDKHKKVGIVSMKRPNVGVQVAAAGTRKLRRTTQVEKHAPRGSPATNC